MSENFDEALPPGSHVNGYRIDDGLGSGGFAITYRATKLGLGLVVALKEYFPTSQGAMREYLRNFFESPRLSVHLNSAVTIATHSL